MKKELIKNNFNIRQALLEAGMAAKGANYAKCYKIIEEFKKEGDHSKHSSLHKKFKIIEESNIDVNKLGGTKKLGLVLNYSPNYASLLYTKYTKYKETVNFSPPFV